MPFEKLTAFTKKIVDLADVPSENQTAADIKAWFDSSPEELRVKLNGLIDDLTSVSAGDSGAKNIGVSPIAGLTGADVETLLQALKTQVDTKTVSTGDHTGSWQGLTPQMIGAPEMNSARITLAETDIISHTAQLADTAKKSFKGNRVFNVESFSNNINSALLEMGSEGGTLLITDGVYNLDLSILKTITGKKLSIIGIGDVEINSTVPEPTTNDTDGVLTLIGDSTKTKLKMENININHTYASGNRGKLNGLLIDGFKDVYLKDVLVNGSSDIGINMRNVAKALISNCSSNNNKYMGLGIQSSTDVLVLGGEYNLNGGDNGGTIEGYGISGRTSIAPYKYNERIKIRNVKAFDNVGKGIDFHNGRDVLIDGNDIKGFRYNGIFAVNESVSKDVKDVKIINNTIDGVGATTAIIGIRTGSFGDEAISSGDIHVSGNTIKNIVGVGNSYSIMIETGNIGNGCPKRVVVSKNTIDNGSSPTGYIIRTNTGLIAIPNVEITENIIHAVSCTATIGANNAEVANISGNQIKVDSGTVAKGILTGVSCKAIYSGNQFSGGATYTTLIEVFAGHVSRMNTLNGALVNDQVVKYQSTSDVDKKLLPGSSIVTLLSGTKKKQITVALGTTMGTIPVVICTMQNRTSILDAEVPLTVTVYNVTATSFALTVETNTNVPADRAITIGWLAIG